MAELILQFASIESLVLDVLLSERGITEATREKRFKDRANLAIARVSSSSTPADLKKGLSNELKHAIDLATQRNAYVHNPLYERLDWILEESELVHHVKPPKRGRPLTIADLRRDVEKTIGCAENYMFW